MSTEVLSPFFRRMTILTAEQVRALGGKRALTRVRSRAYLKVEKGALDPLDYHAKIPREAFLRFLSTKDSDVICRIDDLRILSNGELMGRVLADSSNYGTTMEQLLRQDAPTFRFEPRVIRVPVKGETRRFHQEVVQFDLVYL